MKIYSIKGFDLFFENLALFSKITFKNGFWSNVSLGWNSAISLISFLHTPGVVLSRNIGPKTWHPFGLLIWISTTVWMTCHFSHFFQLMMTPMSMNIKFFRTIQLSIPGAQWISCSKDADSCQVCDWIMKRNIGWQQCIAL